MAANILIGEYRFQEVNSVKVESSWETLADTATIKLPKLKKKLDLENKITAGDKVEVEVYYEDHEKQKDFIGYVKRVKPNIPLTLECEDETFNLRKQNINKSWKDTTVKEVVEHLISGTDIQLTNEVPEVKLGKWRIANANAAQALQDIKDKLGLVAYFRGKKLFVGLAYQDQVGKVKYSLASNVIKNNLTYKREDEVKLKVKVISIKKDNSKIEVEEGDNDGEQRTIYKYNIDDKATLRKIAKEEIQKLKFEGYRGDFMTFLLPNAKHGMTAIIRDPEFNAREGDYVIDKVITKFSQEGGRRQIFPGIKVSRTEQDV
jgi:hypothetical protein